MTVATYCYVPEAQERVCAQGCTCVCNCEGRGMRKRAHVLAKAEQERQHLGAISTHGGNIDTSMRAVHTARESTSLR